MTIYTMSFNCKLKRNPSLVVNLGYWVDYLFNYGENIHKSERRCVK